MATDMECIVKAARRIQNSYPADLVAIACTQHFGSNLIHHFGKTHDVSLCTYIDMLDTMAYEYAMTRGYTKRELMAVKWQLFEAGSRIAKCDSQN